MGVIFMHNTGKALNTSNTAGRKMTYITTSNLYWDRFELDSLKEMYFSESEIEKCSVRKGDLLVCEGGDIGRAAVWKNEDTIRIQNHIHKLRPYVDIAIYYFYYLFYYYKNQNLIDGKGIGIQGLSSSMLHAVLVPLPSYKEQFRIVEQVKRYFELLEYIDNEKLDLFNAIQLAKFKILDLAIRGKLVPQDPNDEPASVLLECIRAEKEDLIKQGKIKRDKKESVIFRGEDNSYYDIEIPHTWMWAKLNFISYRISDGSHNPPTDKGVGIPLLSAANIVDYDINIKAANRWITETEWLEETTRTQLETNDILLTIVGSIGRTAVVNTDNKFAFQRSVAIIKPCIVYSKYLMYILTAPPISQYLIANSKGTAQKGIYLKQLSDIFIPIPPVAEQSRIVSTIETAFAQLDGIANAIV